MLIKNPIVLGSPGIMIFCTDLHSKHLGVLSIGAGSLKGPESFANWQAFSLTHVGMQPTCFLNFPSSEDIKKLINGEELNIETKGPQPKVNFQLKLGIQDSDLSNV
jgi:hypothetical protein